MNWEPPTPASRAHVPGAEHRGHLRRRDSTFPVKLAFSLEVGDSPARGHSLPCSLRGLETQMRKSPCESRSGQTLPSSFERGPRRAHLPCLHPPVPVGATPALAHFPGE